MYSKLYAFQVYRYVKPLTWGALMPECHGRPIPPYPGFLIRIGARGDYVRQIQTCLNGTNNAGLNPDGIFGPLTEAAVINYQRANGLSPDGIVGPLTWENLMRRCAGAGAIPIARAHKQLEQPVPIMPNPPAQPEMPMPVEPTPPEMPVPPAIVKPERCCRDIGEIASEPPRGVEYSAFDLNLTITAPTPDAPCDPPPGLSMNELLMYFMLRHTAK